MDCTGERMQTPRTPNATTAPTPDTPETPETVLTSADSELRAALRETPQCARAAVQAIVGRIIDAPDDERFQRINAESRTFRESGLDEGRALLAALGFVADGSHLVFAGDLAYFDPSGRSKLAERETRLALLRRWDEKIAFGAADGALPGLPDHVVDAGVLSFLAPGDAAIEAGDAGVVDLLALDSTCCAMRRLAASRRAQSERSSGSKYS